METTFFHKRVTKAEERNFLEYVNKKLPGIEQLLTKFSQDAAVLKVCIQKFDKHDAYEVEFCLTLPTKSLIATEASHHVSKAVDLSRDRLLNQIKKHMATLRKDRAHKSIRDHKVGLVINEMEIEEAF